MGEDLGVAQSSNQGGLEKVVRDVGEFCGMTCPWTHGRGRKFGLTGHNRKGRRECCVLRGLGESLSMFLGMFLPMEKANTTHQIPSVLLDREELILGDDTPDKVVVQCVGSKLKVEGEVVFGTVMEVDEGPSIVVDPLNEVVTWLEGKDGVERGDVATAGGEVVGVRVAVPDETRFARRFGKLLFEDVTVGGEPKFVNRGESRGRRREDYVPLGDHVLIGYDSIEGEGDVHENTEQKVCLGGEDYSKVNR